MDTAARALCGIMAAGSSPQETPRLVATGDSVYLRGGVGIREVR